MSSLLVLAAAKPWTYWMAPPLLLVNVLVLLAVLVGYYRKVAVPRYQWTHYEAEVRRREADLRHRPATLPGPGRHDDRGLGRAA
ncbi:MAG TPA: hypothetical protein VM263_02970 [Acidimicrobiales bacterium]|jgi:hypothetical protein|nr:hypothetical protein [Acidimicrobiales bacterium]